MTETPRGAGLAKSSLALTVSAAVTAALGLVYWILMGRLYPPAEVGAASAVIAAATMLAGFGNLGFGPFFERFLPVAGDRRSELVTRCLVGASAFGLVLGTAFVFVGPTDEMFANTTQRVIFPLFVVILSSFALLDHVTIAMYRAHWGAAKNIVHSVAKLVCAVVAAYYIGRTGIAGTWIATALAASLVLGYFVFTTLRSEPAPGDELPPFRERATFTFGNYGIFVVGAVTPLMLPMLVIAEVGADHTAYFAIAWSLLTAVLVLLTMLTGPYVSAASDPRADFRALTRRFALILAVISVASCLGLLLVGPVILRLAGPDYAEFGGPVLRVAAFALPLAAIGYAYTALCRVRRRIAPAMIVQVITAGLLLSLTAYFLPLHGLIAAGWSIVTAEAVGALVSGTLLVVVLRRERATRRPVTGEEPVLTGS